VKLLHIPPCGCESIALLLKSLEAAGMPRVHTLSNSRVYVHARREHPPPHFHVIGPGWEISLDIRTLEVRRGSAPPADSREILEWARANQAYLLERWDEYNERDN
jgi:hypothetical protein